MSEPSKNGADDELDVACDGVRWSGPDPGAARVHHGGTRTRRKRHQPGRQPGATFLLYGGAWSSFASSRAVWACRSPPSHPRLAYGLLEEGLTMQTLFSPTLFSVASYGGRALGINWIWALWVLAYHAIYSVIIPIVLTEALFDERENEPWLNFPGSSPPVWSASWRDGAGKLLPSASPSWLRAAEPHRSDGLGRSGACPFCGPLARRLPYCLHRGRRRIRFSWQSALWEWPTAGRVSQRFRSTLSNSRRQVCL